jgi:hypothetical protein
MKKSYKKGRNFFRPFYTHTTTEKPLLQAKQIFNTVGLIA